MKNHLLSACAALALALPAAAAAQHSNHDRHSQPQAPVDHSAHQASPEAQAAPVAPPGDHSAHEMPAHQSEDAATDRGRHSRPDREHPGIGHENMEGAFGSYPISREASGTAWQPDSSRHQGVATMAGDWMLMGHAAFNLVYDWQEGPRGDEETFLSGMVMGMARRDFANGHALQFRAMLSPDPLMGKGGYPLHLAAGETADGINPLVDRQHPHDLFMELSASYSIRLADKASAFVYAGLPGEPAFGPPAFMHRLSILDSPEAPISHHWLDSTHITFGVITAGLVLDRFKIEASRFRGREPDQHRYNIETGPLDSTALRVSWNPTPDLSLQASWAHVESPEQLEPDENQTRWSASGIHTRRIGDESWWSTTFAWGRRSSGHENLDAWVLESAVGLGAWTLFGRAEHVETNELLPVGGHHGPTFDVAKASLGVIRDFRLGDHVKLGFGGLYAFAFVPAPLEASYGGDPGGAMAFVRLKID